MIELVADELYFSLTEDEDDFLLRPQEGASSSSSASSSSRRPQRQILDENQFEELKMILSHRVKLRMKLNLIGRMSSLGGSRGASTPQLGMSAPNSRQPSHEALDETPPGTPRPSAGAPKSPGRNDSSLALRRQASIGSEMGAEGKDKSMKMVSKCARFQNCCMNLQIRKFCVRFFSFTFLLNPSFHLMPDWFHVCCERKRFFSINPPFPF